MQNGVDSSMGALMEEAKSMVEVGSYHENIVNLQGVTCLIEQGVILQVLIAFHLRIASKNIISIIN